MALQRANVEEIYKKHKEIKKEDVQMILEWLKKEPHLPKLSDLEVITFLNVCNFSIEQTKKVIDIHFTCRTHSPEIFGNRVIDDGLRRQMDVMCCSFLPGLTPDGSSVFFLRFMDTNPANYSYTEQIRLFMMITDLYLIRTGPTKSHLFVADMEGVSMAHMMKINFTVAKKASYYMEEAAKVRLKGFYHINSVPFIDKIMALMKRFAKQEMLDMVQFFTADNIEGLFEFIPKKMLPKNYGGESPSCEELQENMKKDIITHADFFKEEELTRRVNENLRPGKAKSAMDLFGAEGSFKQLEFD